MGSKLLLAALAAFAFLHQDLWLWTDGTLVFGFLPAGLAYHVGFSLATAGLWGLAIRFAWPKDLEVDTDSADRERNRAN